MSGTHPSTVAEIDLATAEKKDVEAAGVAPAIPPRNKARMGRKWLERKKKTESVEGDVGGGAMGREDADNIEERERNAGTRVSEEERREGVEEGEWEVHGGSRRIPVRNV